MQLTAVFMQVPEGYIAFVEELPGANTQGDTLEESRENLQDAVALVLEANRELASRSLAGQAVTREQVPAAGQRLGRVAQAQRLAHCAVFGPESAAQLQHQRISLRHDAQADERLGRHRWGSSGSQQRQRGQGFFDRREQAKDLVEGDDLKDLAHGRLQRTQEYLALAGVLVLAL